MDRKVCSNVGVPCSEAGVACQPKLTRNAGKGERRLLSLIFASWNQIGEWLRRMDGVRQATWVAFIASTRR